MNNIINWENLYKNSETFRKNRPSKFGFVEEFLSRNFYEKLYETFPKIDDRWTVADNLRRSGRVMSFGKPNEPELPDEKYNPAFSKEWNEFMQYVRTEEFASNFRKYSGIKFKKVVYLLFISLKKGDFHLPHLDGYGESLKLNVLIYFSKNWQKGDPGGTYICKNYDESSIIFEPYNLDNTMTCFEETSKSFHGVRYITKDVVRQALQITLA